jgi:hypothetical protein
VFVSPTKCKLEINIIQSNFHIEITPRCMVQHAQSCIIFTQYVHGMHIICTQYAHIICISAYHVHNIYTLFAHLHHILITYSHCLHIICTLFAHPHIKCTSIAWIVPSVHTICTQYVHISLCFACNLHICTSSVHQLHGVCPVCAQMHRHCTKKKRHLHAMCTRPAQDLYFTFVQFGPS